MDLKEKTALITGATSGIGLETALGLARHGATLVLPVRNMEKGLRVKQQIFEDCGNHAVELYHCRLDSFESIREFAGKIKSQHNQLNILVNNAGIWETARSMSDDGFEMNIAVNHLAHFLLTGLLADLIIKGAPSRVINVSSTAHRFTVKDTSGLKGKSGLMGFASYSRSKLANILFTKKLAEELKDDGVTVNCFHPGMVSTSLFDKLPAVVRKSLGFLMIPPEKGAETAIYLAASEKVRNVTGEYFVKKRVRRPSAAARSDRAADSLWDLSLKACGMSAFVPVPELTDHA